MPTKCCWVIHDSLTSERKASTSPSSFINHSTRPCCSIERSSAKLLVFTCTKSSSARQAQYRVRTRRRVGSTRRRGNHMHDHSRFQRDINDVTGVSLSLPLTKVTDAQYRKRFRASYNNSRFSFSPERFVHLCRCRRRSSTSAFALDPAHRGQVKLSSLLIF